MDGNAGSNENAKVRAFVLVTEKRSSLGGHELKVTKELRELKSGHRVICTDKGLIEQIQKVSGGKIKEVVLDQKEEAPALLFQKKDLGGLIGGISLWGKRFFASAYNLEWA